MSYRGLWAVLGGLVLTAAADAAPVGNATASPEPA